MNWILSLIIFTATINTAMKEKRVIAASFVEKLYKDKCINGESPKILYSLYNKNVFGEIALTKEAGKDTVWKIIMAINIIIR